METNYIKTISQIFFIGVRFTFVVTFCNFFLCAVSENTELPIQIIRSGCNTEYGLSKVSGNLNDISEYCSAEKVAWKFNKETNVLEIQHTRILQHCDAQLVPHIYDRDNYLELVLEDKNGEFGSASCVCPYDIDYDVEGITDTLITLKIKNISSDINLNTLDGVIEVDTSGVRYCEE